jgi:hypothetical protein
MHFQVEFKLIISDLIGKYLNLFIKPLLKYGIFTLNQYIEILKYIVHCTCHFYNRTWQCSSSVKILKNLSFIWITQDSKD